MRATTQKKIIFLQLFIASVLLSCSSTRYVPDNKFLTDKVKLNIDNKKISKEELNQQIVQKENSSILGIIRFHLKLYNMSSKKKDNGWLKRIGEAPSIYEIEKTERSLNNLKIYLQNKGYYNAYIKDTTILNKKKANIEFIIKTNNAHIINKYDYSISDPNIISLIKNDKNQQIHSGCIFDVDILNAERFRISESMRNKGYFLFHPNNIQFQADTTIGNNLVNLTIIISDDDLNNKSDTTIRHKQYKINNYKYNTNFIASTSNQAKVGNYASQDTIIEANNSYVFRNELMYKTSLLNSLNHINDSTFYSTNNVSKTFRSLNSIQQFKIVDINFNQLPETIGDSIGLLDCIINLSPREKQGLSIDIEGTNSSGNLGLAANLGYSHRNLFKGAEMLDISFRIARERQQTFISNNLANFNTQEYGFEASITAPKFISPFNLKKIFNYSIPQTVLSIGFNYQNRPDYTRTIASFQYGYRWRNNTSKSYAFNVIDCNIVNMDSYNSNFINSIQDLYIKSSYTDHLIMAMNFSSTSNPGHKQNNYYHYFRWSVESAGNLASLVANTSSKWNKNITNNETNIYNNEEYYNLFGSRFAQYIKGDIDYRYGYKLDKYNSIVARAFIGVVLPYGNFDVTPFEKRYFGGGANSIRAWQVRTLGPGSYSASANEYPNQSADIKIEANLEYRFKLISFMEGAFFFDTGNIWAINSKDNREGAVFLFDEFYKQFAVGSGFGLRFDFSYFILRFDLGMKLIDPAYEKGNRFILGNHKINKDMFNLNFAIGYPF